MKEIVARSGKSSSEFYGMLLFVFVILVNGTEFVNIPGQQIAMVATLIFGYGGGRVLLKNTVAKKGSTP